MDIRSITVELRFATDHRGERAKKKGGNETPGRDYIQIIHPNSSTFCSRPSANHTTISRNTPYLMNDPTTISGHLMSDRRSVAVVKLTIGSLPKRPAQRSSPVIIQFHTDMFYTHVARACSQLSTQHSQKQEHYKMRMTFLREFVFSPPTHTN